MAAAPTVGSVYDPYAPAQRRLQHQHSRANMLLFNISHMKHFLMAAVWDPSDIMADVENPDVMFNLEMECG